MLRKTHLVMMIVLALAALAACRQDAGRKNSRLRLTGIYWINTVYPDIGIYFSKSFVYQLYCDNLRINKALQPNAAIKSVAGGALSLESVANDSIYGYGYNQEPVSKKFRYKIENGRLHVSVGKSVMVYKPGKLGQSCTPYANNAYGYNETQAEIVGPDAFEPNDTPAASVSIVLGQVVEATLTSGGDYDYYLISIVDPGQYQLSLDMGVLKHHWKYEFYVNVTTLTGSVNDPITGGNWGDSGNPWTITVSLNPGDYRVIVRKDTNGYSYSNLETWGLHYSLTVNQM